MRLIKPSFQIIDEINGMELLKKIERAGRTCYKSESNITDDSAIKFVQNIIKRGHESVLEHEKISVRIICDRGVSHELVRHRLASYSQESTRYCCYTDELEVIIPCWVDDFSSGETWNPYEHRTQINRGALVWVTTMQTLENEYKYLLSIEWKPEQARSILPNSLKTEIVMTANLREWRHFFKLRTAKAAHPQMREIAIPMLEEFKRLIPVVFDDMGASE